MRTTMVHATALFAVLSVACGPAGSGKGAAEPARGIAASALPYKVLRAQGGEQLPDQGLMRELAGARAVCIGETHTNPHHHWAQLTLLGGILDMNEGRMVQTALGMEMFQRPFQGVLDDYAAGNIDEAALLSRAGWKERWGYDWGLYSPMVELAVNRGARLLALNVSTELKDKVSEHGVEGLQASDQARLPEMVLDDPEHRAWWDDIMASMGGAAAHSEENQGAPVDEGEGEEGEGDEGQGEGEEEHAGDAAERMYAVQVLWDETMADGAAQWLAGSEGRQVVILAGNGHCHESGIVKRIERRGAYEVVSIRPIIEDGDGEVAALLADPENDYLFVMRPPE